MRYKKGFTLAEVLVTLAIIGVVAALTIPSLIQTSNERQAITSIRKALSTLNQALTMSIAEEGTDAGSVNAAAGLKAIFQPYLNTIDDNATASWTTDGMVYTYYAPATGCSDTESSANCFIEIDINSNKGEETAGTTTSYSDIYYFAVLQSRVIPYNTGMTLPSFGRKTDGTPDNAAVQALTGEPPASY